MTSDQREVRVDLGAVRDNVACLVEHAGDAAVLAVVKADAYGHGLVPCARAALAGGAGWLGTALLDEAVALRRAGIGADVRVLCWLSAPGEAWHEAVAVDVDVSASAPWAVAEVATAAREVGRPARLHLKVDTGLGRAGATPADWPHLLDAAARAAADGFVEVVGLWSHLAYADAPGHPSIARQIEVFDQAVEVARRRGLRPPVRHLANSAATMTLPRARYDLVRPGLAVYGLSPVPDDASPAELGLRPAMTVTAPVMLTKRVPAGTGVSYAHTYTTAHATGLAVVPLGYADGVPRSASGRGPLLVGGRVRRVAGRVCMDQLVVDVGDDEVVAGDQVVLFGPGDDGEPTAQDWAKAAGTISYEIVTRLGARFRRVFTGPADLLDAADVAEVAR